MHSGARHLTLRPEGGDSFLVPEWMTLLDAAAAKIVETPCISVSKPGQTEPSQKWTYVKRVTMDGVPGLVGSGFYPE